MGVADDSAGGSVVRPSTDDDRKSRRKKINEATRSSFVVREGFTDDARVPHLATLRITLVDTFSERKVSLFEIFFSSRRLQLAMAGFRPIDSDQCPTPQNASEQPCLHRFRLPFCRWDAAIAAFPRFQPAIANTPTSPTEDPIRSASWTW